jgi:hypothetical protein
MAIVFSAGGTRWNVEIMGTATGTPGAGAPSAIGGRTGLLFRSVDGETRFFQMESAKLPSPDQLSKMSNQELGTMAFQGAEIRDVA